MAEYALHESSRGFSPLSSVLRPPSKDVPIFDYPDMAKVPPWVAKPLQVAQSSILPVNISDLNQLGQPDNSQKTIQAYLNRGRELERALDVYVIISYSSLHLSS